MNMHLEIYIEEVILRLSDKRVEGGQKVILMFSTKNTYIIQNPHLDGIRILE